MILFTGGGTSGSWQIRGEQLGAACGATVKARAELEDCQANEMIVAVKRLPDKLLHVIQKSKRRWVWDILDAYPQPACSTWTKDYSIRWVKEHLQEYRPDGVIWPNKKMMMDCDIGIPGKVVYHHTRPFQSINQIRQKVETVGYEGSSLYIHEWIPTINQACGDRGWEFILNPDSLSDIDIVLAFRGKQHSGYAQRYWKSNVKLANAHGTGTPFVGQRECGYLETQTGLEQWADFHDDLDDCFDRLSDYYHRQNISKAFLDRRYTVGDAAQDIMSFLIELR